MGSIGILEPEEVQLAEVQAIVADLAAFRVGDWLTFNATTNRLQITTERVERAFKLRDFAANFFKVVEHTPVRQLGINRTMHFQLSSGDDRMALGLRLASPSEWPPELVEPLMTSLTMKSGRPGSDGTMFVTVEPSRLTEIEQPLGVFVRTNEHYASADDQDPSVLRYLDSDFNDSIAFGRQVANDLLRGKRHG